MNEPRSLSTLVAVWTGLGIAASMAVYAVFQYLSFPGVTVGELFFRHMWHVLVLGAVIYAICWAVFRRVLIRPIHSIYLHLYAVGTGKLRPLELESDVTEIRTIVEGVNLMIHRMEHGAGQTENGNAAKSFERMRGMLRDFPPGLTERAIPLLAELVNLEEGVRPLLAAADDRAGAS